ncbi:C6 zinc finger domain protein [Cordyceps militaris CM01]|uniref:C6 zinc finger domain protein n=1 Tax=Cordyceps militaris (strain CM01) TaxID=983644 RepID=G3JP15_CORMM|nr:C6 zinc finger domain protein [Cordyceps militaris CM01]EGX89625.1 C6 zinc finger domain protein [Cordyceps militaris CM01]
MPFRGRPSTACARCRQRRLNCNHAEPCCSCCARAGVPCPGYRNQLDLRFRDENALAAARALRQVLPGKKKPPPPKRSAPQLAVAAVPPCIAYSVKEAARCHLVSNYMQPRSPKNGELSYLLPLVEMSSRHAAIEAAVNAVAMAAWANIRLSPKAMLKAQSEYTIALAETNKALRSTQGCKKDETLALVVLLSIYESLSRIFQEKPNPPILAQLTQQAAAYRNPDHQVLDRLASAVMQLADLCADAKMHQDHGHKDIIFLAMRLDAELVLALLDIPDRWRYNSLKVPLEDGRPIVKGIWGCDYHEYESLEAAKMWNNYRCARIVLQELIIDTVKGRGFSTDAHYSSVATQCRQTLKQLLEDVCASVPFYFGLPHSSNGEDGGNGSLIGGTGSSGLALMWPLLVAANSGIASREHQEWIAVCLDKIGHSMGHNQAFSMAKLLRERKTTRSLLTS